MSESLSLTATEEAFFAEGDAMANDHVDSFGDLDDQPQPSLWQRIFHRAD